MATTMASLIYPPPLSTPQRSSYLSPLSSLASPRNLKPCTPRSTDGCSPRAFSQSRRRRSTAVSPRASSSSLSVEAVDLYRLSVYSTATGEPLAFTSLWKPDEVAVVALLRHFGCACCWELASALKEYKPKFDSAGAKLIAIGVGTPNKARILAERLPFPLECLFADPKRKVYKALGLYHGLGRTFFNPASAKVFSRGESFQKALKNYTIEATPDNGSGVLQQGGMLVFKGRQLVYARKDEGTGDHAPLTEVLQYCSI